MKQHDSNKEINTANYGSMSKMFLRVIAVWIIDAVAFIILVGIDRNISFVDSGRAVIEIALAVTLILSVINFVIRPMILRLAKKAGLITLVLATLLINALILLFISEYFNLVEVNSLWSAFWASVIFAVINVFITNLFAISDDDSFYQRRIERIAKQDMYENKDSKKKGLIVIEIDGLSFHHIKKALSKGYLPTIEKLIKKGYKLDRYDCGLPSQTSACQAGIMFGDNYDIPAFRWYDKDKKRLFVSGKDAAEINKRYAKGQGLLRGGTSIDNMMSGDAKKSLLTLAEANIKDEKFKKTHADDLYLIMISPNFFMKSLGLFLGEVFLEIFQYLLQVIKKETPRLNRLKEYYPLIRGATTVLTREISTALSILEITRGTPALYMTWAGYDEVAHHSGPWSRDAFGVLKRFDYSIERIYKAIQKKGIITYDFVIISDHGQSFGPTFKQRYGYDLKDFIDVNTSKKYSVAQSLGGDDGGVAVSALAEEIDQIGSRGEHKAGRKTLSKTSKTFSKLAEKRNEKNDNEAGHITVCGSGNIAHIYFDFSDKKLSHQEVEKTHPGLIKSLQDHEGIGFVVTYNEKNEPIILSKEGKKNLKTGKIEGKDPIEPYGERELRSRQIKRIADFPHAGDLIVNSTIFPDGTVAALEELIGSHGGLGGEQTDAFILHPKEVIFKDTENSVDLFKILNKR